MPIWKMTFSFEDLLAYPKCHIIPEMTGSQ